MLCASITNSYAVVIQIILKFITATCRMTRTKREPTTFESGSPSHLVSHYSIQYTISSSRLNRQEPFKLSVRLADD